MDSFIKLIKKNQLYRKIADYRWRERKICNGKDNPDMYFYIIRRHSNRAGLFSFVLTNLGAIKDATEKGYVPVVDMKNSPNPMLMSDEVGKVNAWDLFFEQPQGYTLEMLQTSKNVILGSIHPPDNYPDSPILSSEQSISMWRELMHRYVRVKAEIASECDEYRKDTFGDRRILGVLCRGTDYTKNKPFGHPIQPDIKTVISDVKRLMTKDGYELIYLATEDADIWDEFCHEFPGRV